MTYQSRERIGRYSLPNDRRPLRGAGRDFSTDEPVTTRAVRYPPGRSLPQTDSPLSGFAKQSPRDPAPSTTSIVMLPPA